MDVQIAETKKDLERASSLMLQLRTGYDLPTLVEQICAQQKRGYQLAFVEDETQVLCAAGFVVETRLAWGQHMYIEDLVTDEQHRSTGVGKLMLDWLKSYAEAQGCTQIHLDSGVQKHPAHRFYHREGFHIASHHFSITESR